MRMHAIAAAAAAVVVTAAIAVQAQEMPKPAAEMSQMAFFNGNWTCDGKMHETGMGPAGAMTSTAAIKSDLGGFFQSGAIKGAMPGMPPFEGMFHTTFDPAAKQFVMFWFDNMGGWAQSTSKGWSGDTLVYEGDSHMGPMTMKARDTFTKVGADMKHVWEAEMGGKWMALGEETCKK